MSDTFNDPQYSDDIDIPSDIQYEWLEEALARSHFLPESSPPDGGSQAVGSSSGVPQWGVNEKAQPWLSPVVASFAIDPQLLMLSEPSTNILSPPVPYYQPFAQGALNSQATQAVQSPVTTLVPSESSTAIFRSRRPPPLIVPKGSNIPGDEEVLKTTSARSDIRMASLMSPMPRPTRLCKRGKNTKPSDACTCPRMRASTSSNRNRHWKSCCPLNPSIVMISCTFGCGFETAKYRMDTLKQHLGTCAARRRGEREARTATDREQGEEEWSEEETTAGASIPAKTKVGGNAQAGIGGVRGQR